MKFLRRLHCAAVCAAPLAGGAQEPAADSAPEVSRIAPVTITATRQKEMALMAPLAITVIGKSGDYKLRSMPLRSRIPFFSVRIPFFSVDPALSVPRASISQ